MFSYHLNSTNIPKGCLPKTADIDKLLKIYVTDIYRIGKGFAGSVYQIPDLNPPIAIKEFTIDNEYQLGYCNNEVDVMIGLNRLKTDRSYRYELTRDLISIPETGNCYYADNKVYVFMEKLPYSLFDILRLKKAIQLRKQPLWKMSTALALVTAVIRIHELRLIHGDLKPENILSRNAFEFVLADYSMTKPVKPFIDYAIFSRDEVLEYIKQEHVNIDSSTVTNGFIAPEVVISRDI